MSAMFEIILDDHGRICFRLVDAEDRILLTGLPGTGKIAVQNEVLHARQSIRAGDQFVPHVDHDGKHFVVLKDKDGTVLARSAHVASKEGLDAIVARINAIAADAPLLDHARA